MSPVQIWFVCFCVAITLVIIGLSKSGQFQIFKRHGKW